MSCKTERYFVWGVKADRNGFRWDSSDPDRAPPPLPLNPGASSSPITKPNTSARIEEAAALIQQRAKESAPSSYATNIGPSGSPEKSLVKPQHKRMQSIQSVSVKGISDSLERRSPDKGLRTSKLSEYEEYRASRSPERSPTRCGSETPTPSGSVTPSHLNKPILGENTPPSATMLALQTMRNRQEAETPLGNITNMSGSARVSIPMNFDAISSQILSLTSIATNLQREMAQLSRRSKDNATDLMALKEATNLRDEDIRKSLRDLKTGLEVKFSNMDTKLLTPPPASRSTPNLGLYLDNKPHDPGSPRKNFSLPRIPSPTSFAAAIDRDMTASPSLMSSDGAASIALLEKVLREMGTKEGQDKIFTTLESVKLLVQARPSSSDNILVPAVDPKLMKKLEDIMQCMKDLKESPANRALVKASGGGSRGSSPHVEFVLDDQPKSGQLTKLRRESDTSVLPNSRGTDFVNDEIMKMLKSVKQSLSQGGGMTNEVKALVRDLRGEVLGMGREIARKLDQTESAKSNSKDGEVAAGIDEIAQVVQSGLADLKEQMYHIVKENRRQSAGSTKSLVDTQEVVHAVRSALAEMPRSQGEARNPAAEREELLGAIREAWEDCKPEVSLEHFGLERDEILETLKEGLKSYQPQHTGHRDFGITYEEVLSAVRRGLADFKPPPIQNEAAATREEILLAVREVLENFDFATVAPTASQVSGSDINREDILEAIKHGLSKQSPITKEIEFNREDLFDAVRACLEGESNPIGGMGERVLDTMHDFLGTMKSEFQQYSAANGKDTEQVLDAMKDGLEELRADIESYVDRAADVTGKDEIIEVVKSGFRELQADIDKGFASARDRGGNPNTPELLDAMEKEFEHLRESINKSLVRSNASSDRDEILDAIRDMADDRQSSLSSNSEDIVRLVKEELEHMRMALAGTLTRGAASVEREEVLDAIREGLELHRSPRRDGAESILSNTSELLDAFQDGVDNIRSDMRKLMDRPVDLSASYEILDTLKAGLENVRSDIERLHEKQNDLSETATARGREIIVHDENLISTEIEGLKVMITQLRIKVEALDSMAQAPIPPEIQVQKDDLAEIHTAIKEVHHSVNNVRSAQEVPLSSNAATKDDTDAIETLLRNIKAKVDTFVLPDGEDIARRTQLESVEYLLKDIKATVEITATQGDDRSGFREDFAMAELLLKEVAAGVEELQSKVKQMAGDQDENVTKADIQAVETMCLDTKTQIEELNWPDPESLATRDDVASIKDAIKAFQEQIEAENELTGQAFEARKVEHGGLANKIDDVKVVIGDLRDELMAKLDGSEEGIVELAKVLGDHHSSMSTYATATSLAELSDLVNREFERHMEHHSTSRQLNEDGHATLLAKHEDISAELKSKIEDRFNELMTKYDDAQISNDSKLRAMEGRDQSHLDALTNTKAVVEELKLLIDTLGTTVAETCDRLSDDSKMVFARMDDVQVKLGELYSTSSQAHGATREELAKTLATALRLEGSLNQHQPVIMNTLQQILGLVGEHFEHSQRQAENISRATEELKTGIDAVPASIPPLLPPPAPLEPLVKEVPIPEKYDDTQVHDKLNNLLSHAAVVKDVFAKIEDHHKSTQESLSSMDKLEKIHEQVMVTASEISAMVTAQSKLMCEHHESKLAEATEAAIALEKRTAQKEKVEAEIIALTQEKEVLVTSMAALRSEQEELSSQTRRLTREVAKLETALHIRQDEMKDMEARAEGLERRILEGVMNHARSVKISKIPKKPKITPEERDRIMSLKRVTSTSSNTTTKTSIKDNASSASGTMGMALKKRAALVPSPNGVASPRHSGVERRILSTSHVPSNKRDTPNRTLVLAPANNAGLSSLKRSHSVKSNPSSYYGGRKASWNGVASAGMDKENHVLDEEIEQEHVDPGDEHSDAGTERRGSIGGTSAIYTDTTNTSMLYGTGSTLSYTGTRTASYASSIGGTVDGVQNESIAEEDENEDPQHDHHEEEEDDGQGEEEQQQDNESKAIMALLESAPEPESAAAEPEQDHALVLAEPKTEHEEMPATAFPLEAFQMDGLSDLEPPPRLIAHGDDFKYHQPSDSGLGTEPPTADTERTGEAQEYFEMLRKGDGVAT